MTNTCTTLIAQDYYQYIGKLFSDSNTATLVINQAIVRKQFKRLQHLLPQCEHHYAVKAGPHKGIIHEIKSCGGYFDIASTGELSLLKKSGIPSSKIIHTHPIKSKIEIENCIEAGIKIFVVDNFEELQKFENHKDKVNLLVRISFCNDEASIQLSSKFGMPIETAQNFIIDANKKGYTIEGISFHVGSQMKGSRAFVNVIEKCNEIYSELRLQNIHLKTLDIGGGFPCGLSEIEEIQFFKPIDVALNNFIENVRFITEPGRYIVSEAATLIANVVAKKQQESACIYYINESIYNSFSNKVFDLFDKVQLYFPNQKNESKSMQPALVYGNTCDSFDKIYDGVLLPNLEIGEQILFSNMGAYTFASKTEFNMLEKTNVEIIDIAL